MKACRILVIAAFAFLSTGALAQAQRFPESAQSESPLNLAELVQGALDRNPEILAARYAVDGRRARIPQAGAWPDPAVSWSYAGNLLPPFTLMSADPSSARQVMVEQTIPYPGKTHLRTEIAAREADVEMFAYEAVSKRVAAEVKQAYFDLYYVDHSLATLQKDEDALKSIAKVAEIRYSVGKAAQQDILRAQLELTKLSEREVLLRQQRYTLEAQLNTLRDVPVDSPVALTPTVKASPLVYNEEQLQEAARANYPVLKQRRTAVDENRLSLSLAQKDRRPDFSVGYTYLQRDRLPDMYGITLSTSLPLFHRRKQDVAVREAVANLESAHQMEASELTRLRYQVKQHFLEVQASEERLRLYTQGIARQSALTLASSLASYETGNIDFLNVLANFLAEIDAELEYHQQISDHEVALARLEEVTGLDLIQ